MKNIVILILIFLCSCSKLDLTFGGSVYYVSSSGNNSNNGSVSAPWQTLNYAVTKTTTGDIVHVTGTYTVTAQIVVPAGVSIEGENCTLNSNLTVPTFYLRSSSVTNGSQHIAGITLTGTDPMTAYTGIHVENRSNVKIYDCTISNFKYSGIKVYAGSSDAFLPPSSSIAWTTGNEIYNCSISNCGYFVGGNEACISILAQDGIRIHDNTIIADGFGGYHGDCIKGVSGDVRNMKIYNNTLKNVFVSGTTPWDFAIEIWNYYEGNEIYNNVITGSVDLVLTTKNGGLYSVWIHHNDISQSSYPSTLRRGVLLEYECDGVIIEKNYFHELAIAVYLQQGHSHADRVQDIRMSYNICSNIGYGFFISEEDEYLDTYQPIQIYNNLILGHNNSADAGIFLGGAGKLNDCEIKNNIIQGFTTGVRLKGNSGQTAVNLSIQNNIFYLCSSTIALNGITPTGYQSTGNLTTNPNLSNFKLQTGSPGINAGLTINPILQTYLTDYANISIGNPPEIGAYEFGTQSTLNKLIKSNGKLIRK